MILALALALAAPGPRHDAPPPALASRALPPSAAVLLAPRGAQRAQEEFWLWFFDVRARGFLDS